LRLSNRGKPVSIVSPGEVAARRPKP